MEKKVNIKIMNLSKKIALQIISIDFILNGVDYIQIISFTEIHPTTDML